MTSHILTWLHPTLCKHRSSCAEPFRSHFAAQALSTYQAEPHSVNCYPPLAFDCIRTDGRWFARDGAHASDVTWLVCLAVCDGKHPSETCHLCPVLVTTISPVMRALQRLISFSDVTMCYLLLTTVGFHSAFWNTAICLSLLLFTLWSHLTSLPPSHFLIHSSKKLRTMHSLKFRMGLSWRIELESIFCIMSIVVTTSPLYKSRLIENK